MFRFQKRKNGQGTLSGNLHETRMLCLALLELHSALGKRQATIASTAVKRPVPHDALQSTIIPRRLRSHGWHRSLGTA